MSETPNLHIRRDGGAVVASLSGEIDIVNAAEISEGLSSAIDGAESVVVDLDGVSFMDSQGVALLDRLASRLDASGSALAVVVRAGSIPRRVLESSTSASRSTTTPTRRRPPSARDRSRRRAVPRDRRRSRRPSRADPQRPRPRSVAGNDHADHADHAGLSRR